MLRRRVRSGFPHLRRIQLAVPGFVGGAIAAGSAILADVPLVELCHAAKMQNERADTLGP